MLYYSVSAMDDSIDLAFELRTAFERRRNFVLYI